MVDNFRRAPNWAVALPLALLIGCTERMELAPVHVGHQDIHAMLPDYPYPPPVTHGHVPGGQEAMPAPAQDAPIETPLAEPPPPVEPAQQNATRVKHGATIASNKADKKSIMPKVAREKSTPQAPAANKPTSSSAYDKSKLNFAWPLTGRITKNYRQTGKKGIKIAVAKEHAVRAAEAGQVVYCGQGLIGYGNLLIIKHNSQYLTAYANNSALLAKEGDIVEKGQRIATVGVGPTDKGLLHFEIRKHGKAVNPLALLPKL